MSGVVVWVTGVPSSGKSTFAKRLTSELRAHGDAVCLLDGDAVRSALVPPSGYDPSGREAFYTTLANLAALLARQGVTVVVAATAHRRAFREYARQVAPRLILVYLKVSADQAGSRDSKGLYAAERAGKLADLPGADLPYEEPDDADVVAEGGRDAAALGRALAAVDGAQPKG